MTEVMDLLRKKLEDSEVEIRQAERKLELQRLVHETLKELVDAVQKTGAAGAGRNGKAHASAGAAGDVSIRERVTTILRGADSPLTINEIVERSASTGEVLNKNSVRWDLHHGTTEDNVYVKLDPVKGSREKRYKIR